jgi:signal transduction histidine kinase
MPLRYSTQTRAERFVAVARAIIATLVLLVLQPWRILAFAGDGVGTIALVYALFALAALAISWRRIVFPGWTLSTHLIDILFFSAQLFLVEAAIPKSAAFFFPIVAACLLFGWKLALLTSMSMTAAHVAATVFHADGGAIAFRGGVTTGISFVVLAALLIFDRSREEKLEDEMASLSNWPIDASNEVPVRTLLEKTADVIGVRRLIMTWEEPDEPWLHVAWYFGSEFQWVRESPAKYDPLVVDQFATTSFFARHLVNESAVLFPSGKGYVEMKMEPLNSSFRRDFSVRDVLSVYLEGSTFTGRLFALDRTDLTADDLVFGEIVARFVEGRMDHYYLLQRAQQLGVGQERMRLSRDLHDGVLQSLTGASLQLEAVRGLVVTDPDEARRRLSEIQAVLASDQRELRAFIRELRPSAGNVEADRLAGRLSSLADRYRQQWGVRVAIETHGMTQLVSKSMGHEIYSLVSEGVANAAKHASARNVDVRVTVRSEEIQINVKDDGVGFPFTGRFTLDALNELRRGPVSLKERISSLGGALVIDSTPAGSMLEITIPLHWIGPDA